jgi:hypothetical protein
MRGPVFWVRFAVMVGLVGAVLLVLDLVYGVPWLIRTPLAFLMAVGFLEVTEWVHKAWHERARRNRLRD